MPTTQFNRNRGRKSATCCRYSIRRAGGGISLMARSGRDRFLRPRSQPARGDDRMSALSDDLLLVVLRRLDTHTALGTGLLSRRWAHLPRELPTLDFRVGDILPPRYRRWVLLHHDIKETHFEYGLHAMKEKLMPNIMRYERRAMRALTRSVDSLLDAADDGGAREVRRKLSRLRLEFFATHNTACINRLVAKAIDAWGVYDLEAVAKPNYLQRATHTFPIRGLCEEPRASRLRSLKLGGCVLPPLQEHNALTTLVLQDIPRSTPEAAYEGIFASCPQLQVLHLISCRCGGDMVVDAPMSKVRELVVDNCEFARICLRALPSLESLASLGTRVLFESPSFPCLKQYSLTLCLGVGLQGFRQFGQRLKLGLGLFLRHTPDITNLIIRFTGPDRWIVPSSFPSSLLPNLRRLLVADVPSSWDVSWPRLLLETAPSLEALHVHIAPCLEEPTDDIVWEPTILRHHHLKDFVMTCFEGKERQIYLVKFVMGICTALRHVALFKNGHARDKGHWDWEMVTQQHAWTEEEKENTLKQIVDGVSSSTQLVLG